MGQIITTTIDIANVLVDITEHDIELFKELFTNEDAEFTWTFPSEQGHQVNITFRKKPDTDE